MRELITERVHFERELTRRRTLTLFTDHVRNRLVNEVADEESKQLAQVELRLSEAIHEEMDILLNETLYEGNQGSLWCIA